MTRRNVEGTEKLRYDDSVEDVLARRSEGPPIAKVGKFA